MRQLEKATWTSELPLRSQTRRESRRLPQPYEEAPVGWGCRAVTELRGSGDEYCPRRCRVLNPKPGTRLSYNGFWSGDVKDLEMEITLGYLVGFHVLQGL